MTVDCIHELFESWKSERVDTSMYKIWDNFQFSLSVIPFCWSNLLLAFQKYFRRTKHLKTKWPINLLTFTFKLKLKVFSCKRRILESKILSLFMTLQNIFFTNIQTLSAIQSTRTSPEVVRHLRLLYDTWSCKTHTLEIVTRKKTF